MNTTTQTYEVIIIGAGISGLTLANELITKGISKKQILVLEGNDRPGGRIRTDAEGGYLYEWGPEALKGKSENTARIFEMIDEEPYPVSDEASIRYLVKKGKLVKTPSGPISAIFTPLIPFYGKLRILIEPFIRRKKEDETVAEFVKRRFGKSMIPLVDAFVSGVYGGDPHRLSIAYGFPKLKELEEKKGSLFRGGIAHARKLKKKRKAETKGMSKEEQKEEKRIRKERPYLVTTEKGMEGIINSLAKKVNVKYSSFVEKVEVQENELFTVRAGKESFACQKIVVATGVNATSKIELQNGNVLEEKAPEVEESLVTVVSLGFEEDSFEKKVEGYGFLIPSKEERFILGTLYSSRLFAHHAPEGELLLRCFVGGIRHPERATIAEEELVAKVKEELNNLLGLKKEPTRVSVQAHAPKGIPQIMLNHGVVLDWKEEIEGKIKNLYLIGMGWKTITCDGLIEDALRTAELVVEE
jgi:oxygen-dependent protoporphyrinogen oxidase